MYRMGALEVMMVKLALVLKGSPAVPKDWPYWVGGLGIAVINTAVLLVDGRPWGITTTITNAASRGLQAFGFRPETWSYYQSDGRAEGLSEFGLTTGSLWINLGIITGVLLSARASGELTLKTRIPWRKALLALGGGLLMGYGARLASGCNAGALLGSIPSWSLHGWLFATLTFAGILAGLHLFRRLL